MKPLLRVTRPLPLALLAALLSAACSDRIHQEPTRERPGSQKYFIVVHAGDQQRAEPGARLPVPLAVMLRDEVDAPVAQVPVLWRSLAGGAIASPAKTVTDANGIARASVGLGPTTGVHAVMATAPGIGAVTFTAIAQIQGGVAIGNRSMGPHTDTVLGTMREPLVVMVTDEHGVPVRDVVVRWEATGGGALSATAMPTDAGGESIVWFTFGSTAKTYGARAFVPGLAGSPIDFAPVAKAGQPVLLEKAGGDGLTVVAGQKVVYTARVSDAYGNPARGGTIEWTSLGGRLGWSRNVTDKSGTAEVTFTTAVTAGQQQVTATAPGIRGMPLVTFTTTVLPPAPPLPH